MEKAQRQIRNYKDDDANGIVEVFYHAVHRSGQGHYSAAQLEAWAPSPLNYAYWQKRLASTQPFVAEQSHMVVGFIELGEAGHIGCFYVHPDYQQQGIGQQLYHYLTEQARERNFAQLYVEASHMARPFFEKKGFVYEKTNQVALNGQVLTNFSMRLHCL